MADYWEQDLDEWLGDPLPEGDELPEVGDIEHADRLLRKCLRLEEDRAEIDGLYEAEKARIDAWRADRVSGIDRQLGRAKQALEAWGRTVMPANREKTKDLPHGRLKLRAHRSQVRISDEGKFCEWALTNGRDELVKVTVVPVKTAIAKLPVVETVPLDADGKIERLAAPFAEKFTPPGDSFDIDLVKEERP